MASTHSEVGSSEVGLFQQFLVNRLEDASHPGSLDEVVSDFREYQRQFASLQEELRVAEQQCKIGKVSPFDAEATKQRLHDRLAEEGASLTSVG